MQVFHFRHDDQASNVTKTVTLDESATWGRVVAEFAEFLSAIYGYDIKDKVIVNIGGEYVALRQHVLDETINEVF